MKRTLAVLAAFGTIALIAAALATGTMLLATPAIAAAVSAGAVDPQIVAWGFAAAAGATAASSLAAGYAVAKVGTAAIGALAEKPELMARLLIFVGLAEGIAIYGLIISILILNRIA
ncbi:MAG: ATP synthase subunit C [Usitatibacter sp.]